MKILVTGAGGFAGGHLLEYLQAQPDGHRLFALARAPILDREGLATEDTEGTERNLEGPGKQREGPASQAIRPSAHSASLSVSSVPSVANPSSEIRNPKSVEWLSADLLDADETVRAVAAAEPEVIYHLAGHA